MMQRTLAQAQGALRQPQTLCRIRLLDSIRHARDMQQKPRRPGDYVLDRYFANADPETRERARDAFREFARVLEELGEDVAAQGITDSHESAAGGRIPPTPS